MNQMDIIKALANDKRLAILAWLKEPEVNFPEFKDKQKLKTHGICCGLIQKKAGLSQSTISNYLTQLEKCGLLIATRDKQWTYYRRNDKQITEFLSSLKQQL